MTVIVAVADGEQLMKGQKFPEVCLPALNTSCMNLTVTLDLGPRWSWVKHKQGHVDYGGFSIFQVK